MSKKLLALFGGGCQVSPDGTWVPTPDLEVWPLGKNGGRSLMVLPPNDDDPNSVIGMGQLILEAGVIDYSLDQPNSVAIAYGDSSPSLLIDGQSSENEIMSYLFKERIPNAKVEIFDPAEWKSERKLSGTYNEAANLLRLVRRDMFDEMVIVRREVHLRPIIFTMMRLNEPEFADLKDKVSAGELHIQERTVESILWNANSGEYHERINSIHRSRSYQRSLLREGNALMNFGEGITQIIQKSQEQTAPAAK